LSKGAIDAVVKSLAVELAPNVRVNAISPGAVKTPILEKYGLPKEELEKRMQNFEVTIPLTRNS
jgi:NAD(P)-dependent dehydrogenase (short-subunit alcohol dehydrogenase family)